MTIPIWNMVESLSALLNNPVPPCKIPLASYTKLRVAHMPGMPGTFSPPTRVCDRDMQSRHVRDVRAVVHAGIAN